METIAVFDTEPIAIEGLKGVLESLPGLRIVATETSLISGLDALREAKPSLLIVDRAFGINAVMDLLKSVQHTSTLTSVVVWGASFSEAEAIRFLQAGAAGVVRKTAPLQTLQRCVRAVAGGGTWMQEEMFRPPESVVLNSRSPLTPRELQVMELVERGLKNKEIAMSLGIRTGTVKIHLKHIFEKTGIRGRYGLAISGLKEKGLLAVAV